MTIMIIMPYRNPWADLLPIIKNKDGSIKHITREGSREHVLHYDDLGTHCSEPKCEINKETKKQRTTF